MSQQGSANSGKGASASKAAGQGAAQYGGVSPDVHLVQSLSRAMHESLSLN